MKDGAVIANAGHFDVEVDIGALRDAATGPPEDVLPLVQRYELRRPQAVISSRAAAWSTWPPPRGIRPR